MNAKLIMNDILEIFLIQGSMSLITMVIRGHVREAKERERERGGMREALRYNRLMLAWHGALRADAFSR